MIKEKNFDKKIEALGDKGGIIKLSDADRKGFIEGEERYIEKTSEKIENYVWLLFGLGFGILGNFIINLFYDLIKSIGGWKFVLISILSLVLFCFVIYFLFYQFKEYQNSIDSAHESKKDGQMQKIYKLVQQ